MYIYIWGGKTIGKADLFKGVSKILKAYVFLSTNTAQRNMAIYFI